MEKSREESLVYVQRPNEISHSMSISKNPMKRRRCRKDSSVVWYNLDKTKPVKEYICTEFDDCRRKADSSKYFHLTEDLKHRRQEKAIVSDSEFEVQEQDKELKSSESDSSASDSEDSESDEVSQSSVKKSFSAGVKTKKSKLNGELETHNDQKISNMDLKDQNRDKMEYLDSEVDIYQKDAMETALFDVQVTVKASYRAENVPYVCLMSQLNGQAILGYPVEIQELKRDVCETLHPKKESGARKLFDDEGSRFPRLVWKTAKRTPVCYVTNSLSSSVSKNPLAEKDSDIVEDSIIPVGETKLLKNPKKLDQGKEAKSRSCVPVELIFSKILAAVGQLQS